MRRCSTTPREAARRTLAAVSLGAVAPESYAGKLRSQDRLTELAQTAFDKVAVRGDATIARAARADIDDAPPPRAQERPLRE